MKRFEAGSGGELHGVQWRIVQGRKSKDDLRLEVMCPRWTPISMKLNFLCADFYAQNEATLQRQGAVRARLGYEPGDRFFSFMRGAVILGWQDAADQLDMEREIAKERRRDAA